MRGKDLAAADISTCSPVVYNSDLWVTKSVKGLDLKPNDVAFPCGIMARSFFNDSFTVYKLKEDGTRDSLLPINVTSEGIAWSDDKKYKYKNLPTSEMNSRQWLDIEDERFIVWMRAAPTYNFRKLWAKVTSLPISVGKYEVEIINSNINSNNRMELRRIWRREVFRYITDEHAWR